MLWGNFSHVFNSQKADLCNKRNDIDKKYYQYSIFHPCEPKTCIVFSFMNIILTRDKIT